MQIGTSFLRNIEYVGPLHMRSMLSRSSVAMLNLTLRSAHPSQPVRLVIPASNSRLFNDFDGYLTEIRIPQLCRKGIYVSFGHTPAGWPLGNVPGILTGKSWNSVPVASKERLIQRCGKRSHGSRLSVVGTPAMVDRLIEGFAGGGRFGLQLCRLYGISRVGQQLHES